MWSPHVGQPAVDGGVDPGAVLADGARGFDELRDTATLSARTPPIEQLAGGGWVEVAGEHLPQGFFEKVGTPEYSTGAFHLPQSRSLFVGEICRVLQQRPPRTLEGLGDALVGQRPGGLPHLPAHRIERVGDELDDMKWVEADHRGRRAFPHRLGIRRAHVHRHRLDGFGPVGQLVEERVQGVGVLARLTPDDLAGVVVGHQGQIPVVLAPGDLVDTDVDQPAQPVPVEHVRRDPFADRADGAPRGPGEAGDRGLVSLGDQPRHQVLEVAGMA